MDIGGNGKGKKGAGRIIPWDNKMVSELSKQGKICAIEGCTEPPAVRCSHCAHCYCVDHARFINTKAHPGGSAHLLK